MTRVLGFEKWEGLGNDFVVLHFDKDSSLLSPDLARVLCDRHRGIGADGVLGLTHEDGKPRMVVLNADGSRPEMCGNGLRCVAAFEAERVGEKELTLDFATDAGDKRCVIKRVGEGFYDVTVDMGRAKIGQPLEVPVGGEKILSFTTVD